MAVERCSLHTNQRNRHLTIKANRERERERKRERERGRRRERERQKERERDIYQQYAEEMDYDRVEDEVDYLTHRIKRIERKSLYHTKSCSIKPSFVPQC